jgi:polyisoprenoid-binding protein YceI
MKTFSVRLIITLVLFLVLASAVAAASTWNIDPEHSNIMFQVRHLGLVEVKGNFRKFTGIITLDENNIAKSAINLTIDAGSVDTGVAQRDEHLKSADFFDAAKHPTITFASTKVARAGKGGLRVSGDLTINGITKPVVLKVTGPTAVITDPKGNIRRGVSATTTVDRRDFGLTYNKILDRGVLAIGNTVTIHIEAELVKESEVKK